MYLISFKQFNILYIILYFSMENTFIYRNTSYQTQRKTVDITNYISEKSKDSLDMD